jgi:Domain of unknown function (DUF4129)
VNTQRARVVAIVLVVAAGLGLALLASRSGTSFYRPPTPTPSPSVSTLPPPVATTTPFGGKGTPNTTSTINYIAYLYVLLGAAVMFLGLLALPFMFSNRPRRWWRVFLRRRVRYRPAPPPTVRQRAPALLADAVETALATLDEGEVDDAIVTCWLGLERAAAAAGTPRTVAETSAELTERVLTEHQVEAGTLRRLAALYREARYSDHRLGEEQRAEARQLFESVRAELRVPA